MLWWRLLFIGVVQGFWIERKTYIVVGNVSWAHEEDIVHQYRMGDFIGYSVYARPSEIATFRENAQVYEDVEVFVEDYHTSTTYQKSAPWNLARISSRKGGNSSYIYPSRAGEGVDVYVFDTGVFVEHPEFEGRAKHGKNFVTEEPEEDLHSHGTHVAGIVAGKVFGVAKKTSIIAVKTMGKSGSGSWSSILAALNWAYVQVNVTKRPSVFHMSISGPGQLPAIKQVMQVLLKAGIPVVVAAGNEHKDACETSPGFTESFGVVVVASTGRDDDASPFTNFGKCTSLFAPGEQISAAGYKGGYLVKSGTSMAAPHVSGVAAILLSYMRLKGVEVKNHILDVASLGVVQHLPDMNSPNKLLYGLAKI